MAKSGIITVGTSGTAVAGPDSGPGTFALIASTANTGTLCWIGNDGSDDVGSTDGFPLSKTLGNVMVVVCGPDGLQGYYFDADTSGDDIVYLQIAGEGDGVPAV